jgi:WD40 repeat protein
VVVTAALAVAVATSVDAASRRKRPSPPAKPPVVERPGDGGGPATNAWLEEAANVAIPGRGMGLAWAPDGHAVAVGGHFKDRATRLRYDTRIYDLASGSLAKSYSCHWFWVISLAWVHNPYLGEVIADGGGDHAVKLWDANAPGSTTCVPGQFRREDGGIRQFGEINGWITSLAFSPDGRFLAATSRDRAVRLWQIAPGPNQWRVVALWYDADAGNFLSLSWAPDGRHLVTGDHEGRVALWSFDAATDLWDDATIASFARATYETIFSWYNKHLAVVTRTPVWSESGHLTVWGVDYSPDGSRVAAASADGLVSVYDAATGAVVFRTGAPRTTGFHSLDWSPDGRFLAAGAKDKKIYVFDAADGGLVDVLAGHMDVVTTVAWSPDSQTLASVGGGPLLSFASLEFSVGPDMTMRLWTWR